MPDINDKIIAAEPAGWVYEKPKKNGKMQLLTIGGVAVSGTWRGEVGDFYLAWAPLLKRDKVKEAEILKIAAAKLSKRRQYRRILEQTAVEVAEA